MIHIIHLLPIYNSTPENTYTYYVKKTLPERIPNEKKRECGADKETGVTQ